MSLCLNFCYYCLGSSLQHAGLLKNKLHLFSSVMQRSRRLLSTDLLLFVFVSVSWSFLLKHWDQREKWKEERSQLLYEAIQDSQRMFKPLCPSNSYLVLVLGAAKDSVKCWRAGSLQLRIGSLTEACLL